MSAKIFCIFVSVVQFEAHCLDFFKNVVDGESTLEGRVRIVFYSFGSSDLQLKYYDYHYKIVVDILIINQPAMSTIAWTRKI